MQDKRDQIEVVLMDGDVNMRQTIFEGDVFISKNGQKWSVIYYESSKKVSVKAEDTGTIRTLEAIQIRRGDIKDPLFPSIHGMGFLGTLEGYNSKNQRKAYTVWSGMIERCYSPRWLRKYPSYVGCSITPEWLNFQVFCNWYLENALLDCDLDKDIKVKGNKVYSPDTCIFVHNSVNKFMTDRARERGSHTIGVHYRPDKSETKPYYASMTAKGKPKHIGCFRTELEAFKAYTKVKLNSIDGLDCSEEIKRLIRVNLECTYNEIEETLND